MRGSIISMLLICFGLFSFTNYATAQNNQSYWDVSFFSPGVNGSISSIAVRNERLVVAGFFSSVGAVEAFSLAGLDLQSDEWTTYGITNQLEIHDVEILDDNSIVIGGRFESVGGIAAKNIAMWSNGEWYNLGAGLSDRVRDVEYLDGRLFASGNFVQSGATEVRHIAEWTTNTWIEVGGGLSLGGDPQSARAYALDWNGSQLFVGGNFDEAGSAPVSSIAMWDGFGWSGLDSGVHTSDSTTPVVFDLEFSDGSLYVGGEFSRAGSINANNLARWNGSGWESVANGINSSVVDNIAVCPVGPIDVVTSGDGMFILKRNTDTWIEVEPLEPQIRYVRNVTDLLCGEDGRALVGFGAILIPEDYTPSQFLFEVFSDASLSPVMSSGHGVDGPVFAASSDRNQRLYIGGHFTFAGRTRAQSVAYWDGGTWNALGDGLYGDVNVLLPDGNGGVYAGGRFGVYSKFVRENVAHWNGEAWSPIGDGLIYQVDRSGEGVYALSLYNGGLYAGGIFDASGVTETPYLARYENNTGWVPAAGQINGPVWNLTVDTANSLIVSGSFSNIGSGVVKAQGIARYSGGEWQSLSGTNQGPTFAVIESNEGLFASGSYTETGVGVFDQGDWISAGPGIPPDQVNALCAKDESKLVAVGSFDSDLLFPAFSPGRGIIAALISGAWSNLQVGRIFGRTAIDCAFSGSDIFVVGSFIGATNDPFIQGWVPDISSSNIARLVNGITISVEKNEGDDAQHSFTTLHVFPNPANEYIDIEYVTAEHESVQLEIIDTLGRIVDLFPLYLKQHSKTELRYSTNRLPTGMYVVRANSKTLSRSVPVVIIH